MTYPVFIAVTLIDVTMQMTFWRSLLEFCQLTSRKCLNLALRQGPQLGVSLFCCWALSVLFVSSWVSDNIFHGKRRPMIATCFLCMIPCILILFQPPPGVSQFTLLAALRGAWIFRQHGLGTVSCVDGRPTSRRRYTGRQWDSCRCSDILAALFCPLIMSRLYENDTIRRRLYLFLGFLLPVALLLVYSAVFMVRDKKMSAPQL